MFELKMSLNEETLISLFDRGSHSANDIQKVLLEYMKSIFSVIKITNTASEFNLKLQGYQ